MSCCKYEQPSESELEKMEKCWHFEIPGVLVANPMVFMSSFLLLWGFVIACCVEPDYMGKAMGVVAWEWIPEVWTWLYIVSQDIWVVVLLWVMYKYGGLKLGKDDDEPEFSTATWFSMLFCAGVATGLFYFSVAEPLWHYKGSGNPRFHSSMKGYGNEDEDATHALMVTLYHWGLHGWIPYSLMGAVVGIMTFRRGFPMTIRYCFYPLIGDACYGIMGDLVDALSIVTTIGGVCTSLGLGAIQINTGLQRVNHGFYRGVNYAIPEGSQYDNPTCGGIGQTCADGEQPYGIQSNVGTQILIILIITGLATLSVVLGLSQGIKFLSQFVFALGNLLLLTVLFSGETYFILDTIVQVTGYYVWYLLRIGFHCDAFERLGKQSLGLGGSPNEKGFGGSATWLTGWTLFYWGWWISWGPFVGTFLAKISRGRTLRQFILCTLFVPTLYSIVWFGVYGGEGIRMQRMADGSNMCSDKLSMANCSVPEGSEASARVSPNCASYAAAIDPATKKALGLGWTPKCQLDPVYHGGFGKCKEFRWTRFVEVGDRCVENTQWVTVPCGGEDDPTALAAVPDSGPCKGVISTEMIGTNSSSRTFNHFAVQTPCFVGVQDSVVCLYNQGTTDIFFDQLASYGPRGFSDLLSVVAIACLTLYFVTSSDSGSLVVDILSANGHPDPPIFQRIFWSFTEGATAIALLYSGVNSPDPGASLSALQAASIICGLPYTFVLFWCAQSLVLLCKEEAGDLDPNRKPFSVFIFNARLWQRHLVNALAPGAVMGRTVAACGGWPFSGFGAAFTQVAWTACFMGLYWVAIILQFCGIETYNWHVFGLSIYLGHGVLLGLVRNQVRDRFKILHGDLITDLLCGIFVPMFTVSQIEEQMATDTVQERSERYLVTEGQKGVEEAL